MVGNLRSSQRSFIASDSPLHRALMPLLYYEIFSYPLTLEEILRFNHDSESNVGELQEALDELEAQSYVFRYQKYYLTRDCPDWIIRREEHNARAERFLGKAQLMTHLIRRFPFVRGVFLSGSLSKNVMPKDGDIDYFVITEAGRLWIARTLLVLFKKIFLLNSYKYFCVNYFVDIEHLEIEEKNRFTATEIVTLLPVYNPQLYQRFYEANHWVGSYFPHSLPRSTRGTIAQHSGWGKRLLEKLLRGRWGDWLDAFFMKRTLGYWNRKFKSLNPNNFSIALKSRRYVSKHHPQDFQHRVMNAYEARIQDFEERHFLQVERQAVWQLKD
ncbi:MAG: nucleotidyltransferase domain-containing protein [Bacteroidota bacterium]